MYYASDEIIATWDGQLKKARDLTSGDMLVGINPQTLSIFPVSFKITDITIKNNAYVSVDRYQRPFIHDSTINMYPSYTPGEFQKDRKYTSRISQVYTASSLYLPSLEKFGIGTYHNLINSFFATVHKSVSPTGYQPMPLMLTAFNQDLLYSMFHYIKERTAKVSNLDYLGNRVLTFLANKVGLRYNNIPDRDKTGKVDLLGPEDPGVTQVVYLFGYPKRNPQTTFKTDNVIKYVTKIHEPFEFINLDVDSEFILESYYILST